MSEIRMNIDNDILNELKEISPLFADLPKTNVFTVPDGYFKNLSDNLFLHHAEASFNINDSELSYDIPEGYFNNLSNVILDKINLQESLNEGSVSISLSTQLSAIQKNIIFEVPKDYFNNLSVEIINTIKQQQQTDENEFLKSASFLQNLQSANIFEVPENYFENLSVTINDKITSEASQFEIVLSEPLNYARTISIFTVPAGYFNGLADSILNTINIDAAADIVPAVMQNLQQINIFNVPDNYFENLSDNISAKINSRLSNIEVAETEAFSPLLHSLQKQNVYNAPVGYFDNLPATIFAKASISNAKIIVMPRRKFFVRLAAAAIFTGVLATGIYNFANRKTTVSAFAAGTITNNFSQDSSVEKGKKMNLQQFNEAINNLSKEDLINYLEKNNSEEDVTLLTSSLDENTLPDKNDYLLDEKTLDKYLNLIKLQN